MTKKITVFSKNSEKRTINARKTHSCVKSVLKRVKNVNKGKRGKQCLRK